jgi:asparagine synthase (glutamine-hydrolysing)
VCGIAGFIGDDDGRAVVRVRAMLRAQQHRGPDGAGVAGAGFPGEWRSAHAGRPDALALRLAGRAACVLGHNWLAVQDSGDAARQPMHDLNLALSFNGEVYNFVELRRGLERDGVTFRSRSDTEVLWHLWARDGAGCLPRLRGMFAFAACDRRDGTLWLVRDPLGIKPLYFALSRGDVAFASEARALHAAGFVQRRLRDDAVVASAAAGVNKFGEAATLYEGVHELPAGHWLRVGGPSAAVQVQRYYDLPDPRADLSGDEATTQLRAGLEESVRLHLRASRKVASCLSGGLDSTNLAWMIGAEARHSGHEYDTFTIRTDVAGPSDRPDCREGGELAAAALVAKQAGLRHHLVDRPTPISPRDVIEMIVAYEVPNHVIGPVNQFLLFREVAAAGVTVVLDGQGGDELLSGYPWFPPVLLDAMRKAGRGREADHIKQMLARRLPLPPETAAQFDRMFHDPAAWAAAFMWQGDFLGWSREKVLDLPETRYYLAGGGEWRSFRRREYYQAELPYLLRQEDRLGMWFGLECRVPFVDAPLIDVASRLAPDWLIKDGYLKYPFRVMLPELPESVRWDTRKRGFWEVDRSHFDWLPAAGKRLAGASDQLNRLFPSMRDEWDALSFDQQWRLTQLAVLERGATREDVDDVCKEAGV